MNVQVREKYGFVTNRYEVTQNPEDGLTFLSMSQTQVAYTLAGALLGLNYNSEVTINLEVWDNSGNGNSYDGWFFTTLERVMIP